MKKRILLSGAVAVLLASILVACVGGSFFPGGTVAYPTVPKFVVAVDGSNNGGSNFRKGNVANSSVNVFPVNATTGVLGAAVTGSPFDLGVTDAMTMAVHPNGHFVYAADGGDGSIHAWDVNETTGVPTQIATPTINESGTFYEPCCGVGDAPTHVITVTPNGNFLYSANNDATVGAYKINTDGSLAHIADLNIGACDTGAITGNDTYVWVTDTCGNTGPWNVWTHKIGATGALTSASSIVLTGVDSWLWSIQINPVANFIYVGDEGGGAQIFSFSVAVDGSLTQLGPQLVENNSSDVRDISHSPDGKFFYTTDDDGVVHVLSVDTITGAITELAASPYPGGAGQIVVDLTGSFVYMGDQENTGQIIGYTRDMTTGALTLIGNTTTASGAARAIAIIR
jgi:6-phosphogluconolactonase (cycloisomerase 2 family)